MKSFLRSYSALLLLTATMLGCAGHQDAVVNTIESRNTQLEQADAPIRVAYRKTSSGLSFRPYLLGKIESSAANPKLIHDVLNGILNRDGDQALSLIQVRRIKLDANSAKEVWVVKNEKGVLYAYSIHLTTTGNGTDFHFSEGYKVYEPMLNIKNAEIAPLKK